MNVTESVVFKNISATTAAFQLKGGLYHVVCIGTSFGTVTLQVLAADASTWVTALTAFAAAGAPVVNLSPGQYRVAVATTTAVYISINSVPY